MYIGDSLKNLLKIQEKPDVIFIDPPYNSDLYDKALSLILEKNILNEQGIVIMEHPVSKLIKNDGFELIKAKVYSDKQISFLKSNQVE